MRGLLLMMGWHKSSWGFSVVNYSPTEWHDQCGSWLACDAGDSVSQANRGDAIAGKPAPTVDPVPTVTLGRCAVSRCGRAAIQASATTAPRRQSAAWPPPQSSG
ncbi:hypothetical protein FPT15_00125 [Pseudomonas sp. RGB]|nr:hypothetical protein FPT15_00125 [Pseudomonas sp. RGB]